MADLSVLPDFGQDSALDLSVGSQLAWSPELLPLQTADRGSLSDRQT